MSGRHAEVTIDSQPANAHVVVRDKRGKEVATVHTPGKVTLKRKDRFIFPARYTASIAAPGYQPAEVPLGAAVNPWVLGNVVVGGIPGLVVDNVTGAVWKPRQSSIYEQLTPLYGGERTEPSSGQGVHVAAEPGASASELPAAAKPAADTGPSLGPY